MTSNPGLPFAQSLLQRAFSPDTAATHYTERISKRPLPIRATSPTPSARATRRRALTTRKDSARKRSAQKPRPLSAAQKRKLALHDIPKAQQKYDIYEPLHKLWQDYMRDILGLHSAAHTHATATATANAKVYITPSSAGQQLVSADMHGAKLLVARSRCVDRVGLEGIVVRDTRFTFELVTRGNAVKSVPKEHTIFRFELPLLPSAGEGAEQAPKPLVFEIFGDMFCTRASDRANRKFKLHYQRDL